MPELPEVETIVRGLGPTLRGRLVTSVWGSGKPLHLRRAVDLKSLRTVAVGHTIRSVARLGKYILIGVAPATGSAGRSPATHDDRDADRGVIVHLGMTGRLRVWSAAEPRVPHTHVVLGFEGGDELRFSDPRRFGWVTAGALATNAALAALGPDPLTALDEAGLVAALTDVRAPIKAFLLDQRRIAGLGNIYVSEALHRAGIHPATPAGKLRRRAAPLLAGIRASLEGGIARRGTTLRDYVDADGLSGDNAAALLVYGRDGQPCLRCGTQIRRRVDAGRATFFCPSCQKR